jgi:hypothetical protein
MLIELCVAVWAAEEGAELEEMEEEEEESGNLDEEEMKKMQSDEVPGDGLQPLFHPLPWNLPGELCTVTSSTLSLLSRAQRAWR